MRCPKCHYLSFDPEPRCKNCGYDLEVADAELAFKAAEDYSDQLPDLELRRDESSDLTPVPMELRRDERRVEPVPSASIDVLPPRLQAVTPVDDDVWPARSGQVQKNDRPPAKFVDDDDVWPARSTPIKAVDDTPEPVRESTFRIEPVREDAGEVESKKRPRPKAQPFPVVPAEPAAVVAPAVSVHPTTELPLFVRDAPAPPRAPLSVRRTVAEPPRVRSAQADAALHTPAKDLRVGPLDRDLLEDLRRVEHEQAIYAREAYAAVKARVSARADTVSALDGETYDDPEDIPPTQRLAAAALDGVVLGGIGTVALWATLRVTGAGITSFGTDAIVAFLVFLGAVSVAYLLMFTAAGGQTVGKMLMGLRVVGDTVDSIDDHLTMAQAALRAVLAPLSVLALGLGWLPALFGRGLALHDRLAHTRVIRA